MLRDGIPALSGRLGYAATLRVKGDGIGFERQNRGPRSPLDSISGAALPEIAPSPETTLQPQAPAVLILSS
jgi:hypothetical protein